MVNLCLLSVFLRLAASWNVTPGNVGVLELVAGYLTTSFGHGSEAGVLLVLEFRLVVFVAVALMAFGLNGRQVLATLRKPSELENDLACRNDSDLEKPL